MTEWSSAEAVRYISKDILQGLLDQMRECWPELVYLRLPTTERLCVECLVVVDVMFDVEGQGAKKDTVRGELKWSNVSRCVCFATLGRANGQRIS